MTFLGGLVFYAPLLELSFVLDGIGVTSSSTIGLISALAALATAAGSAMFRRISGVSIAILLPLALGLGGGGLVVLGLGRDLPVIIIGAVVCSAGCGLLLPTLLVWALGSLSLAERGRASGVWYSCSTSAQFACPLIILAVGAVAGGRPGALVTLGVAALALAVATSRVRAASAVT